MNQKRILILGVGEAQENLIRASKEMGYYTIVCDMRSGMPGEKMADCYYRENYQNKDTIYSIAVNEHIDGVVSNSEPAMINVAYLVDQLGLPGNSVESVQNLLSKKRFRELQNSLGVYSPLSFDSTSFEKAVSIIEQLHFPIIVKPSESSGSRGTTRFDCFDEEALRRVFEECKKYSRNGHVIIEEYIPMEGSDVYNADIFVIDEVILWDGWYSGKRSDYLPLVPMSKVFPPIITTENRKRIEKVVNSIIRASGVSLGEFNVEAYITDNDKVFVIEINPRQAGDSIPKLIFEHSGVDLSKLLVSLSVNDSSYYEEIKDKERLCNYITLQVVFPHKSGVYEGLHIHKGLKKYVQWIDEFKKIGDYVEVAKNAEDSVAYVCIRFNNRTTQIRYTNSIEEYIYPIIT